MNDEAEPHEKSKMLRALEWSVAQALDGGKGVKSASELAEEFGGERSYKSIDDKVNALIRWQVAKNGGTGAIGGLGGAFALPVALSSIVASMGASWIIQARLIGAVALLYGHDLKSDRVRTAVMWCLIGDTARAGLSTGAQKLSKGVAHNLIGRVSAKNIKAINKAIMPRFITKGGTQGVVNLGKLVPLLGGVVGAAVDGGSCYLAGRAAKKVFKRGPE